jgi:LEA14-like dessication related protein
VRATRIRSRHLTLQLPRAVVVVLGVALLASCVTAPRLVAPRVAVDSVRLDRIAGGEARFDVLLSLTNPNARELAVETINASVTVDDVPVGTATLKEPLRLPANGDATATLQARAGVAAVLRLVADFAQRAQEQKQTGLPTQVRYSVSGNATVQGGYSIPFSRSGEFRIGPDATFNR